MSRCSAYVGSRSHLGFLILIDCQKQAFPALPISALVTTAIIRKKKGLEETKLG